MILAQSYGQTTSTQTPHSSILLDHPCIHLAFPLHLFLSFFTFSTFLIPCSYVLAINQLQPNIQFSPPSSRSICHLLVLPLPPSLPNFSWWNNSYTFFDSLCSAGESCLIWEHFWLYNNQSFKPLSPTAATVLLFGWEHCLFKSCQQEWIINAILYPIYCSTNAWCPLVHFLQWDHYMSLLVSSTSCGWQAAHMAKCLGRFVVVNSLKHEPTYQQGAVP